MMLRSSSTPILGSLLPSFTESPGNEFIGGSLKHSTPSLHQNCSFLGRGGSLNISKSMANSNSSENTGASSKINGFRKVQSEGNLKDFANADEFSFKKSARKPCHTTLEAIPSFSFRFEEDDSEDDEEEEGENLLNLVSEEIRTSFMETEGGQGKMYLAAGLGVCDTSFLDGGGDGGRGGSCRPVSFYRDGEGNREVSMEEHYKRMMRENPGNPLFLRNYAQFLYQSKKDLVGAEEYYSRAILADPHDGELLSQYARLIWEFKRDKDRAMSYFQRAIQASSTNSHIQATYASFLWELEDDEEDENNAGDNSHARQIFFSQGALASATA